MYLDDIAAFWDDWESHLVFLEKLLTLLQENGFTVNPVNVGNQGLFSQAPSVVCNSLGKC